MPYSMVCEHCGKTHIEETKMTVPEVYRKYRPLIGENNKALSQVLRELSEIFVRKPGIIETSESIRIEKELSVLQEKRKNLIREFYDERKKAGNHPFHTKNLWDMFGEISRCPPGSITRLCSCIKLTDYLKNNEIYPFNEPICIYEVILDKAKGLMKYPKFVKIIDELESIILNKDSPPLWVPRRSPRLAKKARVNYFK